MFEKSDPPSQSSSLRRERNKQAKLDRIKEAAWTLFVERGFAATTLRDIAAQADVSTGTVFLYVNDKADLLLMVFSEAIAAKATDVFQSQRLGGPLNEVLLSVFTPFLNLYRPYPGLARDFLRETLFHSGPWRDRELEQARAFMVRLATFLAERQATGEMRRDLDVQQFALTLFSLYQTVLVGWLSGVLTHEQAHAQLRTHFEFQVAAALAYDLLPVSPSRSSL